MHIVVNACFQSNSASDIQRGLPDALKDKGYHTFQHSNKPLNAGYANERLSDFLSSAGKLTSPHIHVFAHVRCCKAGLLKNENAFQISGEMILLFEEKR